MFTPFNSFFVTVVFYALQLQFRKTTTANLYGRWKGGLEYVIEIFGLLAKVCNRDGILWQSEFLG